METRFLFALWNILVFSFSSLWLLCWFLLFLTFNGCTAPKRHPRSLFSVHFLGFKYKYRLLCLTLKFLPSSHCSSWNFEFYLSPCSVLSFFQSLRPSTLSYCRCLLLPLSPPPSVSTYLSLRLWSFTPGCPIVGMFGIWSVLSAWEFLFSFLAFSVIYSDLAIYVFWSIHFRVFISPTIKYTKLFNICVPFWTVSFLRSRQGLFVSFTAVYPSCLAQSRCLINVNEWMNEWIYKGKVPFLHRW